MQDESPPANGDRTPRPQDPGSSADEPPRILVCVDLARETSAIIPPARAMLWTGYASSAGYRVSRP